MIIKAYYDQGSICACEWAHIGHNISSHDPLKWQYVACNAFALAYHYPIRYEAILLHGLTIGYVNGFSCYVAIAQTALITWAKRGTYDLG